MTSYGATGGRRRFCARIVHRHRGAGCGRVGARASTDGRSVSAPGAGTRAAVSTPGDGGARRIGSTAFRPWTERRRRRCPGRSLTPDAAEDGTARPVWLWEDVYVVPGVGGLLCHRRRDLPRLIWTGTGGEDGVDATVTPPPTMGERPGTAPPPALDLAFAAGIYVRGWPRPRRGAVRARQPRGHRRERATADVRAGRPPVVASAGVGAGARDDGGGEGRAGVDPR